MAACHGSLQGKGGGVAGPFVGVLGVRAVDDKQRFPALCNSPREAGCDGRLPAPPAACVQVTACIWETGGIRGLRCVGLGLAPEAPKAWQKQRLGCCRDCLTRHSWQQLPNLRSGAGNSGSRALPLVADRSGGRKLGLAGRVAAGVLAQPGRGRGHACRGVCAVW